MLASVREREKGKLAEVAQPSGPPRARAEAEMWLRDVFGARRSCASRSPVLLSTNEGTKITCMTHGVSITLAAATAETQPCFPVKLQNQVKEEKEVALRG